MLKQIVVGSELVSYLEYGSKQAQKTLLFLHGWQSSKEVWNGVVSKIKDGGFKIVVLDFPGFGNSSVPKKAWSVGDYAESVKKFIEKLELKNVILVGHSFGGRVAIKLGTMPGNLIAKIILVDAAGFVYTGKKKTLVNIAAKIVKPFFKPKFMQGLRKKIYKAIDSEDYLTAGALKQTYIKIISEDLSGDMKHINAPTLIVTGENDQDTPVEFGVRMNSLIRNSQFAILKNAGHFSFLDQPEEFVKIIGNFI